MKPRNVERRKTSPNIDMTATEFDRLPALLRRKDIMTLAGVSAGKYYDFVSASRNHVVTVKGYKEKRLRKECLRFLMASEDTQTLSNLPKVTPARFP